MFGKQDDSELAHAQPGGDRPHSHGQPRPPSEQGGARPGLGGFPELGGDLVPEHQTRPEQPPGPPAGWVARASDPAGPLAEGEQTLELREERLVPRKDLREVGEVVIRTEVEEVPSRLEVQAYREEVEVEHVPVGQVVKERVPPWEEDNVLVVPVYEEQLVVVKRLLLREHLRIRRVPAMESQLFEDTVRRERVTIEYPENTGLVHEQFPTVEEGSGRSADAPGGEEEAAEREEGGLLEKLGRKLIE